MPTVPANSQNPYPRGFPVSRSKTNLERHEVQDRRYVRLCINVVDHYIPETNDLSHLFKDVDEGVLTHIVGHIAD